MRANIVQIDIARCVANYMIVFFHAGGAVCQYCVASALEYRVWYYATLKLCNVALPTLFLVSGFCFFRDFQFREWPGKLWRRVKRLAVPYLAWNALFVVFYVSCSRFAPRLAGRVQEFGLDTLNGAVGKIASLVEQPIDVPLWFVRTLLYFAFFAPVAWCLLRHRVWRWIGAAAVIGFYVWKMVPGGGCPAIPACPAYAVLTFYIGGLLAAVGVTPFHLFRNPWWVAVGIIGMLFDIPEVLGQPMPSWRFGLGMLLKMPMYFALVNLIDGEKLSGAVLFKFAKDASFFVFAGHFLFCSIWVHLAAPMLANMETGKFTLLAMVFCGPGLATTVLAFWMGRRYLTRVTMLFDGTL